MRFGTTHSRVYLFKWIKYSLCSSAPDFSFKNAHRIYEKPSDLCRFVLEIFSRGLKKEFFSYQLGQQMVRRDGEGKTKKSWEYDHNANIFSCIEHVLSLDL